MFCSRDQILEVRNHLATVADAERERIFTAEEFFEFLTGFCMEEYALSPAFTCTQHVSVAEAAASDKTLEVLQGNLARKNVRHVNVNGFKARAVKSGGHFDFTIHALFTEDRHLRTAFVILLYRHIERDLRRNTGIVLFELQLIFAFCAFRIIAESSDTAGRVAPNGAEFRNTGLVIADDKFIRIVQRTDVRDAVAETCCSKGILHRRNIFVCDLEDRAEFFVEENFNQRALQSGNVEGHARVTGEGHFKGRDEEIDYAEAHNVPLKISRETNYSKDKNLWHLSHEGLDLEDPANEPQYEKPGFLEMGVSPITAPDAPTYVTIDFEKGVPVAVDGEKMKGSDIIRKLNKLGGENGIGLLDIVENRLVGMKDRGVYETPGGTILYKAHQCLEMITVDKDSAHMKAKLAVDFADLIYNGKWFTPVREALSAFADKTQEHVTGSVKLKLYKGNMITASITSPESLYSEELVTFNESSYDQTNATGFINLWGLPDTVLALREQGKL